MEVCVDSIESSINAVEGGATRLELCSSLAMGGTTPTLGLLHHVKQKLPNIIIHVLIRCRDGDFHYTEDEIQIMVHDIKYLVKEGADGIVIGCLDENGNVNVEQCNKLIHASKDAGKGRQVNITFHRAFDMTPSNKIHQVMNDIIKMGCSRILTSGQGKTAVEGSNKICELIENYQDKIIIMPGGGLNENTLVELLKICLAKQRLKVIDHTRSLIKCEVKEFHASARVAKESAMKYRNEELKMGSDSQEYAIMITSSEKVRKMVDAYDQFCQTES